MKCREVRTLRGEEYTLTQDEEKYVRALEQLSKMNLGSIRLSANGKISVRYLDSRLEDSIDYYTKVRINCKGGNNGWLP